MPKGNLSYKSYAACVRDAAQNGVSAEPCKELASPGRGGNMGNPSPQPQPQPLNKRAMTPGSPGIPSPPNPRRPMGPQVQSGANPNMNPGGVVLPPASPNPMPIRKRAGMKPNPAPMPNKRRYQ